MFGLLAALLLVASFVIPTNLASPSAVQADPGICKWDTLMTPGYMPFKFDVVGPGYGGNDIQDMAVGGDGATIVVIDQAFAPPILPIMPTGGFLKNIPYYSNNNGITFTIMSASFMDQWRTFHSIPKATWNASDAQWPNLWLVAIAPDNPKFWAVVSDGWNAGAMTLNAYPTEVWVTSNAGAKWECTNFEAFLTGLGETTERIRTIDVSVDYGGKRDIAVGTEQAGLGTGDVYVIPSTGFGGWKEQNFDVAPLGPLGDFYAIKFSPTYPSDASLAMVYADLATGTSYNIALRDIDSNTTNSLAFTPGVLLPPASITSGTSPLIADLNRAELELPSDFSGQAASLRRAYISLDCWGAGKAAGAWDGILRIDNSTVYLLMDTSADVNKSIYSISYFGTYASGKLLAGERMGFPCTAEVPTWFTDSPTTCPVPCWYPALKPTTGAADNHTCSMNQIGIGAALTGWRADGQVAFAATGSHAILAGADWFGPWVPSWPVPWSIVMNDESAFAISRNNGETWNQTALIDTSIDKFTDVAPTPDCNTVYLASVNYSDNCSGFDSVWRTSQNPDVVAPYPPLPLGIFWERVLTRLTGPDCEGDQTDRALLRLVPYCADPTGEIVAWGVYDTNSAFTHGIAAWSPDYGDYWANISVRDPIQDFCFESRTVMYFLSPIGKVQKMPYTGTAWSTSLPSVDSIMYYAHTIAAYPEGKVLVGAGAGFHQILYAASFSGNFNTDNPSFDIMALAGGTDARGNVHVAFSPDFKDNDTIFIADEYAGAGSVYRNISAGIFRWADTNMLSPINGAVGCWPVEAGYYGLVLANTGGALYAASGNLTETLGFNLSGVERTLDPLAGMPKPGVIWDLLDVFVSPPANGPLFTLEPSSLKICGCCTMDTDSTLYAIDNADYGPNCTVTGTCADGRQGLVWAFTDCLAKRGPALVTEDKMLIGCDPVSGRAQEVNLCWEQLCVASGYDIEISKDEAFTIKVIDWVGKNDCTGFLVPVDVTTPCAYIPAGGAAIASDSGPEASAIASWGNLECGHTYYWHVQVRACATGQIIRSPWSDVRSFTVKAGLPVSTPYYGPQLLSPNNGCLGCPVSPVSFSWSPFKETTKYKFVLASDAAMTQVIQEAEVATTAFEYAGKLDYSTNYFWRVMSLEPAPSDWSATFSFQTEAAPPPVTPEKPAPTPVWVWVVIAIGAILVIVTLVLIFKTRRV
jgi:hypothetical protein